MFPMRLSWIMKQRMNPSKEPKPSRGKRGIDMMFRANLHELLARVNSLMCLLSVFNLVPSFCRFLRFDFFKSFLSGQRDQPKTIENLYKATTYNAGMDLQKSFWNAKLWRGWKQSVFRSQSDIWNICIIAVSHWPRNNLRWADLCAALATLGLEVQFVKICDAEQLVLFNNVVDNTICDTLGNDLNGLGIYRFLL